MVKAAPENKGTAFTREERAAKKILGLLPHAVETQEQQLKRTYQQFKSFDKPINKYTFLAHLESVNTCLYYKFIMAHMSETLPIVYTPTVGEACQQYSHIFRRPSGMYFTVFDKGHIRSMLDHWEHPVDIIVVSDGGRILGLGDLGVNGMGIPVGKLALYVAGGGFNPQRCLPVMLDTGTDNKTLLEDPFYLGVRQPRVGDEEYYPFVEEFCMAVKDKWPNCLVQFEDFATPHAIGLLEQHRSRLLCFNDDIQGTGSVILAGFLNAIRVQGTDPKDVRCVFFGAGSAAIGVALTIVALLESLGLSNEEARNCFWLLDTKGLMTADRADVVNGSIAAHKLPFVRKDTLCPLGGDLLQVIKCVKPHILMGLAGSGPQFMQDHVEAMLEHCARPIIFPLSNPTSKAEISAENAYRWTNGKCIFASGSPFDPVEIDGQTYYPAQGNNMFIFPGVGFGAVLCKSTEVTDAMFVEAAKTLALLVPESEVAKGRIYPSLNQLREVSAHVAARTMEVAFDSGLARIERPNDLIQFCLANMWHPDY